MNKLPERDIVVIGGSMGGIEAVQTVLASLCCDFRAALFIVLHRSLMPDGIDRLAEIFDRRSQIPTDTARHDASFEFGHAYLAPAGHHLEIGNGFTRLMEGPRENRSRPSADVLFRSAASTYGRRVIGVVLSGAWGEDGSAGLWQIKEQGGVTIVQDPEDARFGAMPANSIDHSSVDHVLLTREIGPKLMELTTQAVASPVRVLVAENDSQVAANLQRDLSQMGYTTVDWAHSAEAACALAERNLPDVVLMAIHLAGESDGIEAGRWIKRKLQIPVVYCTALGDLETLEAVKTTQSYGFLLRPYRSLAVRAAIELAIDRRENEKRHPPVFLS